MSGYQNNSHVKLVATSPDRSAKKAKSKNKMAKKSKKANRKKKK